MQIDAGLLRRARSEERSAPVLRLYGWARPALSMGRHQGVADEILARCRARGVDTVRRPTGGTAVLHGRDLTYAVVAPTGGLGVLESYRWVARGLIAGLARLELAAEIGRGSRRAARVTRSPACFAASVQADLQVGGAKICGSAQIRRGGWFLQHGSIPMQDDSELLRELLQHREGDTSTCMAALRPGLTSGELAVALVAGFELVWGEMCPIGLPAGVAAAGAGGEEMARVLA